MIELNMDHIFTGVMGLTCKATLLPNNAKVFQESLLRQSAKNSVAEDERLYASPY